MPGRQRWRVCLGKKYLGVTKELPEAKKLLETAVGAERFRQLKSPGKMGTRQCRVQRFRALHRVFRHFLPGDLEAALQAHTGIITSRHHEMPQCSHEPMFLWDPLLEVLSIQGKTGPWKNALYLAWQRRYRPDEIAPVDTRTAAIILDALTEVSGRQYQAWSDSCGRNNQHHSGWLALVRSLDLIELVEKGSEKDGDYVLGQQGLRFRPKRDLRPAWEKLARMKVGASVLQRAWSDIPRPSTGSEPTDPFRLASGMLASNFRSTVSPA